MLIKLSLKYNSRKIYLRLLNILMYPSGYSTSNLLLIISIIIGALGAALVRIIGLESLFLVIHSYQFLPLGIADQSNNLFILGLLLALLVFNTIYLKVIIFTKVYYLISYAKYIKELINRFLYVLFKKLKS